MSLISLFAYLEGFLETIVIWVILIFKEFLFTINNTELYRVVEIL